MATSGFKSLFNLNPLVKLDGYYLLSDFLEVPNLRRRAFAYLGAGFRRLLGMRISPNGSVSRRERKIFLLYGVVAGSYSILLFALVAAALAGFLVTKYRGWGFVGFSLLLLAIFRAPVRKLLKVLSRPVTLNAFMRSWVARFFRLAGF